MKDQDKDSKDNISEYARQAEDTLHASELRYRRLFESAPDGILILDFDTGQILDVNPYLIEMLGYSHEEYLGKKLWEVGSFKDVAATKTLFGELQENGYVRHEDFPLETIDGRAIAVEFVCNSYPVNGKTFIQCNIRDITDRRRAEKQSQENEKLYRALFEAAGDCIYILDTEGERPGQIVSANSAAAEIHGYAVDEMLSLNIADLDTPESAENLQARIKLIVKGETVKEETTHRRKDGSVFPLEINARLLELESHKYVLAIDRDITDRRQMDAALKEIQGQQKALLDNIPDIAWLKDKESRFIAVNQSFGKACGVAPENLRGRSDLDIWPFELAERYRADDLDVMASGKRKRVTEPLTDNDGKTTWIETIKTPIYNDAGENIGTAGIARDITERKRAEETLRLSEERYRRLFEDAPLMYVITWNEEGVPFISDCNELFLYSVGYTREEALGKQLADFYTPESRAELLERGGYARALAGEFFLGERELVRRDGSRIPTLLYTATEVNPSGKVIGTRAMFVDITERKRAEEALREREDHYRDLVENIQDLICTHDLQGNLLFVNQAPATVLGYSPEDLVGTNLRSYVDPEARDLFDAYLAAIRRDGQASGLMLVRTKSGEKRIWEYGNTLRTEGPGEPIVRGLARDITDRKKAEEGVIRANQEWERTFNAISDPIMVLDHNYEILRVNNAMADAVGMTKQELIGKLCFELVHGKKAPPAFCPHSRLLADGEEHSAEVPAPCLGGLLYDFRVSPLVDQRGRVMGSVHVMRDVTERKMKEEALMESEERFRLTFLTSPDSININRLSDGLYIDVNNGFTATIGYSREEIIGKSSLELNIWHNPQDRQRLIQSLQEAGYVSNMEAKFRAKDGAVITGLMSARVIMLNGEPHIVSITRDIEEWKRTQSALKESEQRYRALFEESMDAVFSVLRDGEITDANASFCKLFGYTREEMIGKDIRELYLDPAARPKFQEEIEKNGSVKDYQIKFRKRDGTEIDCLLTSSVHFGQDGSIAGYRGILRDLTLRKGLQRQLLQAQKMESIGTLAGGIAHDFNNLLTVVLGFSELLLIGKDERDPSYADLQKIHQSARSGADLVRRILLFSRKAEINPRPLNLNHEIEQTRKMLVRTIPKMIKFELVLSDEPAIVHADPTQLEQVILNLAVNAQDAMPDGGKLTFETKHVTLDEAYCGLHVEAKPGDYVMLSVSDTGHGMDHETLSHIFEPFYTTKETGKGTGLGLAMVYGIVKQHGGYINCYSEPETGTTFKIYLPVIPPAAKLETLTAKPILPHGTETILLVDDEEMIRDLGKRILERSGYTALTAANGKEALNLYRKKKGRISLVILDLIMPEMGGRQCLEELLKIDPQVKVLIASGYSASGETKKAIESGAMGFVDKPYDISQVLQAVRQVLDQD
jgi:two-component system, cell cycle sensor histidine kinase and response regulator CckA